MNTRFTAAEVRARFPNPVKSPPEGFSPPEPGCPQDVYCVGGALQIYLWRQPDGTPGRYFPQPERLTYALKTANPTLSIVTARILAKIISEENDRGNFEAAWKALDNALTAGSPV